MIHSTRTESKREYEYTTTNQHGDRYKLKGYKNVRVLTLSTTYDDDKSQMWLLLSLCSSLDIPPIWSKVDGKQCMSVEVVAKKSVM